MVNIKSSLFIQKAFFQKHVPISSLAHRNYEHVPLQIYTVSTLKFRIEPFYVKNTDACRTINPLESAILSDNLSHTTAIDYSYALLPGPTDFLLVSRYAISMVLILTFKRYDSYISAVPPG